MLHFLILSASLYLPSCVTFTNSVAWQSPSWGVPCLLVRVIMTVIMNARRQRQTVGHILQSDANKGWGRRREEQRYKYINKEGMLVKYKRQHVVF